MLFLQLWNYCCWWWWLSSMFRWLKRRLLSSNLASKCQQGQVVLVLTKIICFIFPLLHSSRNWARRNTSLGVCGKGDLVEHADHRGLEHWIAPLLGTVDDNKTGEFSEKFQGGRGHFESKNLRCRFWTFKQSLLNILFRKSNSEFPKMRGGQRPFGTFPKIHPFWYRRHPSLTSSITWSSM